MIVKDEGPKLIPFVQLLELLADNLCQEIKTLRNIEIFASFEEAPWDAFDISILKPFSTKMRTDLVLCKKESESWAKELAIKLARPFPATSYRMELPGNVHESAIIERDGLILRGVTDYCIESKNESFSNHILYRFSLLVSWKE